MRIFPFIVITFGIVLSYSCANIGSPTGGPRDTIPPILLKSTPQHKSINYQDQEFRFLFDERVNTDKLKQNLIITPLTENKFDVKFKKYEVILKFEEPFDSATTYTLNFGDGIVDVTEKNPVENFAIAFSTGSIIDSISVSGLVKDLFTNEEKAKFLVALYPENDTVDILTGKPRYFTKTGEEGEFLIENIKNGKYRIYAYDDKNNNLVCDPADEAHGFLSDTINLNTNMSDLFIRTLLVNSAPLEFSRGKITGTYYDLAYNKYIEDYTLEEFFNPNQLPLPKNSFYSENTNIRFYYDSAYRYEKDSIGIIIRAQDSLQNSAVDTAFIRFRESKRKPLGFEQKTEQISPNKIEDKLKFNLHFNKPIEYYTLDSMFIQYDTLYYKPIPDSLYYWNKRFTKLNFDIPLDPKFFKSYRDSLLTHYSDTTIKDSIYILQRQYLNKIDTARFKITIPQSSFISIEQDSSKAINKSYSFLDPSNTGSISGRITTDHTFYILQLTSPNFEPVKSIRNPTSFVFNNIPPGKYTFRILIDTNSDGKWNTGNILRNEEPEPAYFYPEVFDVRANWQLENVDIQF